MTSTASSVRWFSDGGVGFVVMILGTSQGRLKGQVVYFSIVFVSKKIWRVATECDVLASSQAEPVQTRYRDRLFHFRSTCGAKFPPVLPRIRGKASNSSEDHRYPMMEECVSFE
jgi:hypothetical protein